MTEATTTLTRADLLYPPTQLTPAKAQDMAIAGETDEYTEMYPNKWYCRRHDRLHATGFGEFAPRRGGLIEYPSVIVAGNTALL